MRMFGLGLMVQYTKVNSRFDVPARKGANNFNHNWLINLFVDASWRLCRNCWNN
jgi:hypothetical protein